MSTHTETIPNQSPNFIDVILRYWPIIVTVVVMILGYGTLQNNLNNLQARVAANEAAILTANASYADIAGDIKGINAKLDILLKKNQL